MEPLEVVGRVREVIEPLLEAEGTELVDAEFQRETVGWVLRLFIDRPAGVDLDACAHVSELVSRKLDEDDIVPGPYNLEVSSPGVERRLTKPEHYQRFVGRRVVVKTDAPVDGRRRFTGVLKSAGTDSFEVDVDGRIVTFAYRQVARAQLVIDSGHP